MVLLLSVVGCGGPQGAGVDADPHLAVLTKLYVDHLNANQGQPPRDEKQFKEFIRANGASRLKERGLEDLDALFVSARDDKPLVIFYGRADDPRLRGSVVGHEQLGIDGSRCVGMRYGTVQLVDEAQFAELVPER